MAAIRWRDLTDAWRVLTIGSVPGDAAVGWEREVVEVRDNVLKRTSILRA